MPALLFSKPAAYLLAALVAIAALWGVYAYIDDQGYQRAAVTYEAKIVGIHADYAAAALAEAQRQAAANNAAKALEASRIAEMQAANQSLQQQVEELEHEASQDPDAGKPVLGAPSVRRINKIR
jgi:hypothetical protein